MNRTDDEESLLDASERMDGANYPKTQQPISDPPVNGAAALLGQHSMIADPEPENLNSELSDVTKGDGDDDEDFGDDEA